MHKEGKLEEDQDYSQGQFVIKINNKRNKSKENVKYNTSRYQKQNAHHSQSTNELEKGKYSVESHENNH